MFTRNKKRGWAGRRGLSWRASLALALIVFSLLAVPGVARAMGMPLPSLPSIGGILAEAVGSLMFYVGYFIASVLKMFISINAWAIGMLLQIQSAQKIVNLPVVSIGHNVMLSLTNLGFVAAIIFIAVATILRLQTYNVKKTLWKLIIAALLVNFSLVFAGAIMNLSDQMSNIFLKQFPGQGEGADFAEAITTAFSPQKYLNPQADPVAREAVNTDPAKATEQFAGAFSVVDENQQNVAGGIGQLLAPIFGLVMTVVGLMAMGLVLSAFSLLLLIRYIALSILLVLMPMVWLFWIFPGLSGMWTSWWKNFFRWAFFAPIVLFFLWLVIQTGKAMVTDSNGAPFSGETMNFSSSDPSDLKRGISNALGQIFTPIIGTVLNGLVLVGLMVGGLFAANKLSITGAGAAVTAIKGAGKGAAKGAWGYTKNKATTTLGRPPDQQKAGFKGFMQKMNPAQQARKAVHAGAEVEQKAGIKEGPLSKLAARGTEGMIEQAQRENMKNAYISRYGAVAGRAKFAIAPGKPSPGLISSVFTEAAKGSGLFGKSQKLTKDQLKMLGLKGGEEEKKPVEIEKKPEQEPVIIAGTPGNYRATTQGKQT